MAHFYGQMQGGHGVASRCGTASSGLWAHVRGWNIGVMVDAVETEEGDVMRVYATSGSSATGERYLVGEVKRDATTRAVYWSANVQGSAPLW